MMRLPVSLVVITLNEEKNIARCLNSVPWASDIVVLDSGSSDQTVAIAKKLGARTFSEAWRGYTQQKIRACELAEHDWILSLDADEALSEEAASEIASLMPEWEKWDGFELARLSFHLGRWIRHGGWYPDWQTRFFNRRRAQWVAGHVHERVAANKLKRLSSQLYHYPFGSLEKQIDTNNEYSSLAARDLQKKGQRFSLFKMLLKPWGKFIETYLIKRGFLDGLPGFIISVGAAYSMFLKFAKLRELERLQQTQPSSHLIAQPKSR